MPMPPPTRRRRRPLAIAVLLLGSSAVALGLAELTLRLMGPSKALGVLSYADAAGNPITPGEALARGQIVEVTPPGPRPRTMFAPGNFFLCYSDQDRLQRDWLDANGRIAVRINSFGLHEREIPKVKPTSQRRIVCIGDSFTFGWGIPEDAGWVRRLENDLRRDKGDVLTINCGAAGTVCVDEYVAGLTTRFHEFGPDAVILTICLNDLIPNNGVQLIGPAPDTGSVLLDRILMACGRTPLQLDPALDWVDYMLKMDRATADAADLTNAHKPFEAMWSQGVPQKSLREAKAFCEARKILFLVTLWPFLQGLGPGRHYPFQKLHDLVAGDCKAAGIPFLDVTPALRGTPEEELWVTPADPHANPKAQQLALAAIAAFVRQHLTW
jgi:lysophospholipase L1-like esterase